MENIEGQIINNNELEPESLGSRFKTEDHLDFIDFLIKRIKEDPSLRFSIVTDWVDVQKARAAKALFDQYANRLNIDSITIRATREQYEEDVNVFQSGVKWEEVEK